MSCSSSIRKGKYIYMKAYDSSKESSYIQYLDTNNLYRAVMSEKLPMNRFRWVNDISK